MNLLRPSIGSAIVLVFAFIAPSAFAATAVQSGDWSDTATWGGPVPAGLEEDIVIPDGIDILLDMSVECGELLVNGTLDVDTADLNLTCDSLIVQGASAAFTAGTDGSRFTNRFILTLKGEMGETFTVTAGMQMHDLGARGVIVLQGGTLNLHGADRVEWTHLGANVAAGSSALTMSEPVDWAAGDQILICSSRRDWNEAEQRTVASVTNGGLTVNLTTPLTFPHTGVQKTYTRPADSKTWTADLRAEVGLLSRNITIQGASDSTATGFGAHVMIHGPMEHGMGTYPSGKGYVKGVELFRVGQKSLLGRYPYHWHLNQDSGAGQYFSDNAVHLSFNRALTIHGTDYLTVENNFCYDHIGHGIFLEDGAERFNVIRKNVVVLTKRPAPGEEVIPSDNELDEPQNRTPASFWITNPNNTFEDNVAAGTHGTGYWFIFPFAPLSPSVSLSYYTGLTPNAEPLGSFARNKAHSTMNGFDIFDELESDHGIFTNVGWFETSDHVMEDCTWYANETALYSGDDTNGAASGNLIFRNNVLVDNQIVTMFASYSGVEESVVVADSGEGLIGGNRYLWRAYDGAGSMRDSHLIGWDDDESHLILSTGGAFKRPNHRFSGITTNHSGLLRSVLPDFAFVPPVYSGANSPGHPRYWQSILRDEDGSLTGIADASIISNHPFMRIGDELKPPNFTYTFITPHKLAVARDIASGLPDVSVTRTKSGTKSEYFYFINGFKERHQLPVILNEDFLYSYDYVTLPLGNTVTWILADADPGDAATLRFPGFGGLTGITVTGSPSTAYGSLAAIFDESSTSSGYFIDGVGDLYLRLVAESDGKASQVLSWTSGSIAYDGAADTDLDGLSNAAEGGPGQDTDGDGVPDYRDANSDGDGLTDHDEVAYGLDPHSASDLRFEFGTYGTGAWFIGGTAVDWNSNNGGAYEVVNGSDAPADPILQIPLNDIIAFDGNEVSTIRVRYRSDASGTLQLFWSNESGGFSGSRVVNASSSYAAGSGFVQTQFDVGSHPEWAGHIITQLRLDTISVPNSTTWVDWIRSGNQSDLPDNDLDDDGVLNDEETFFGTDPNNADSDFDGLTDAEEIHIYRTDPNNSDSDGDGLSDRFEILLGTDPNDALSVVSVPVSSAMALTLLMTGLLAFGTFLVTRRRHHQVR